MQVITTALQDAGIDLDAITTTPDGVTTATATDGSRVSMGEDGDGWIATAYGADNDIETTQYFETIERLAAFAAKRVG